jgi:NAD(P)-dependent dehydrogenase (short-subunit alcohol dehydrogenase family)
MTQENVDIIVTKTGRPREEAIEHILATNPQHRMLQPDEVAAAVAYLCTDDARGINGQAITIDGGNLQW